MPPRFPDEIHIDLTGLDIGDSIHISQVKLPKGSKSAIEDRDFTVATVVAPSAMKAEEAEEAAEAVEGRNRGRRGRSWRNPNRGRRRNRSLTPLHDSTYRNRPSWLAGWAVSVRTRGAQCRSGQASAIPARNYALHRHNVGFMAIDTIAELHRFPAPRRSLPQPRQRGPHRPAPRCCCSSPRPS